MTLNGLDRLDGWPWPWEDSSTTDYAYAFDGGRVYASRFGSAWFRADEPEPDEPERDVAAFPDMSAVRNVAFGARSGAIFIVGYKS